MRGLNVPGEVAPCYIQDWEQVSCGTHSFLSMIGTQAPRRTAARPGDDLTGEIVFF